MVSGGGGTFRQDETVNSIELEVLTHVGIERNFELLSSRRNAIQ
jgi:hypothetical protein